MHTCMHTHNTHNTPNTHTHTCTHARTRTRTHTHITHTRTHTHTHNTHTQHCHSFQHWEKDPLVVGMNKPSVHLLWQSTSTLSLVPAVHHMYIDIQMWTTVYTVISKRIVMILFSRFTCILPIERILIMKNLSMQVLQTVKSLENYRIYSIYCYVICIYSVTIIDRKVVFTD